MIKKIINREFESVNVAALVLIAVTFIGKLVGLLRESILTFRFSVSDLDVYYTAFRIPDFIFNIIVAGALSAGFVPIFTKLMKSQSTKKAMETANNVFNILLLGLLLVLVLSLIFTPQIITLIAPGFDIDKQQQTVILTRIMFLSPVLMLMSGIAGGILQSFKRFFLYALSPVMYNLGIIVGVEFLSPYFGLAGLAWGVVLGALLQFVIQLPAIQSVGFRYMWIVDVKSKELHEMLRVTVPRILTTIVTQINALSLAIIASTLAYGSVSVFNLAHNLHSFPLGVFAVSFAVACFPTLSGLHIDRKYKSFAKVLIATGRQILYFVIPLSVLIVVLRAQLVRIILGHGYFGWRETVLTLNVLQILCFSLFAQALIPLLSRGFWSIQDSKTPFLISLFCAIVSIILALFWSKPWEIYGIAAAYSVSHILHAAMLFWFIRKKNKYLSLKPVLVFLSKVVGASVLAGLVTYRILYLVEPWLNTRTFLGITIQCAFAGFGGMLAYIFLSYVLRIKEIEKIQNAFSRKIKKLKTENLEMV